jgi:type VI secretion system secreted protein Hcp
VAYDAFLWFTGGTPPCEGETTDETYKDKKAIEILSFSLGAFNPVNIGSTSGGAGAGKVDFSGVSIMKNTDKSSISLFANMCAGTHFTDATIALRRAGTAGKSGDLFLQFTFKMVFISNMQWSGGGGQDLCAESLNFDFGSIKIEYFKQDAAGKQAKAGEVMWSRIKNLATDAVA